MSKITLFVLWKSYKKPVHQPSDPKEAVVKHKLAIVLFIGALACAGRANANDVPQSQVHIEARIIEIGGMAEFGFAKDKFKGADQSSKYTSVTLLPVVGCLLTNNVEAEIAPIIAIASSKPAGASKSDTETHLGALLRGAYHFGGESNIVPFVFVGGGILTNSYTGAPSDQKKVSLILPEGGVGVKAFASENTAIRMEAYVRNTLNSGGTKDLHELEIGARAGLSFFIRPHIVRDRME
jgi:outer membrane protein W